MREGECPTRAYIHVNVACMYDHYSNLCTCVLCVCMCVQMLVYIYIRSCNIVLIKAHTCHEDLAVAILYRSAGTLAVVHHTVPLSSVSFRLLCKGGY